MESQLGHHFGRVRVHADDTAARSAAYLNAHAYTVGSHVVFGSGQYAPETAQGTRLLAHELAHVVQQTRGEVAPHIARAPRSLDQTLAPSALTDEEISREIDEIRAWLRRNPSSSEQSEALLADLGRLGQELAARHPQIAPTRDGSPLPPIALGSITAARVAQAEASLATRALLARTALAEAAPVLAEAVPALPAAAPAAVPAAAPGAAAAPEVAGAGLGAAAAAVAVFLLVLLWPSPTVSGAEERRMLEEARARQRRREEAGPEATTAEPDTSARPRERAEPRVEEQPRTSENCSTRHSELPLCSSLPGFYVYSSYQAALAALKRQVGNPSLSIRSPQVSTEGPCPGIGMHYNVRSGRDYVGSIVCCPCCQDTPAGPVLGTRCGIV